MYHIIVQVQIFSCQRLDSFREHKVVIYDNRLQNYDEISLFCVYSSVVSRSFYNTPEKEQQRQFSAKWSLLSRIPWNFKSAKNYRRQIDLVLTTSIQWVGFLERECSYVNLGFHENITELLPLFRFLSVPSSVVQSKSFVTVLRYIRTIFSGELLDLVTLSHCILILNPSVASCIGKPNGYNLSKPSIYQAQFWLEL